MEKTTLTKDEEAKETATAAQVREAKEKLSERDIDPELVGQHYKWHAREQSGAKKLPKQQYPTSSRDAKMTKQDFEAQVFEQ